MINELLSRFIKRGEKAEILLGQEYETFSPKGTTIQGYVSGGIAMIDANVGFLESGIVRKIKFEVDSGSYMTLLMPEDARHLLKTGVHLRKGYVRLLANNEKIEGTFMDTEVWFSGKHTQRDVLLAMKLRVFVLGGHDQGSLSLLGRDVLGHFRETQIVLAHGKVVFKAKESDKVKAYRKPL